MTEVCATSAPPHHFSNFCSAPPPLSRERVVAQIGCSTCATSAPPRLEQVAHTLHHLIHRKKERAKHGEVF
jgi:hypothetical protein